MKPAQETRLQARLAELESVVDAIRGHEIDAVVGTENVLLLRLKKAEQALADREAWLRLVNDECGVALVEWNLIANTTRCNDMFWQMAGRPQDSLTSIEEWINILFPDDRPQVRSVMDDAMKRGGTCSFDCRIQNRSEWRWIEYHGRIQLDDSGRPARMIGAIRDITERKEAEVELEVANRRMEAAVAERTRALHRQTIQLRKLATQAISSEHRERKRLAALLHDHLQQFLVAAKLRLQFAQRSDSIDTLQQAIRKSVTMLEESIEVTRGLSRELRPPILQEQGLIAALGWLCMEKEKLYGLRVRLDANENAEPRGEDLKSLLFECVRELLFNVVKHGGVNEASLDVQLKSPDTICITVKDRGAGFDAAAGQQSDQAGVGLYRIGERLASIGGRLEIAAMPNRGTCATLMAPLEISIEDSPLELDDTVKSDSHRQAAPDDRVRVLIADDHVMVREGIASMVEGPSMTVVAQVGDGIEAVSAVERYRPQIVLMDLNMPRMNGADATRAIHQRWPEVAVIGLSVQDDDASAHILKQAGARAFIPKSHDPEELLDTILSVL